MPLTVELEHLTPKFCEIYDRRSPKIGQFFGTILSTERGIWLKKSFSFSELQQLEVGIRVPFVILSLLTSLSIEPRRRGTPKDFLGQHNYLIEVYIRHDLFVENVKSPKFQFCSWCSLISISTIASGERSEPGGMIRRPMFIVHFTAFL